MSNFTTIDESKQQPMVAIAMLAYNHEKFIVQAIESVLMQKTSFKYKIIIAEDCSTDKTRDIIIDYQKKYPDKIKLILQNQNVGASKNNIDLLNNLEGKYIAALEGDDYWTDPLKLQKQVDFLEENEDFSMACNSSSEVYEDGTEFKIAKREESIIDLGMVLREGWFIRTASIVFRREAIKKGFPDFFFKAYSTDYILQIMILKYGKCIYFPEVMSAYRGHDGGISNASKVVNLKRWQMKITLLSILDEFTDFKFSNDLAIHKSDVKDAIAWNLFIWLPESFKIGFLYFLKFFNPFRILQIGLKKIYHKLK